MIPRDFLYAILNRFLPSAKPKQGVDAESVKPIWIIGSPRSGTTLVYQFITTFFKCSYLTNFVGKTYRKPETAARILRHLSVSNRMSEFSSNYGNTKGILGAHEGGQLLYRFFDKDNHYANEQALGKKKEDDFRKIVSFISDEPMFVWKNTVNSLRIRSLNTIFPNSYFIRVQRNPVDTICSIYKARMKQPDPSNWWSVKPPNAESVLHWPVLKQCCWQYLQIESIIERDLSGAEAEHSTISYQKFCNNTDTLTHQLTSKLGLQTRDDIDKSLITSHFRYSSCNSIEIETKINDYLIELTHDAS